MLPITLELPIQNNLNRQQQKTPLPFKLKVVQEGLFTELRVLFPSDKSSNTYKSQNNISVMPHNKTVMPLKEH